MHNDLFRVRMVATEIYLQYQVLLFVYVDKRRFSEFGMEIVRRIDRFHVRQDDQLGIPIRAKTTPLSRKQDNR